MKKSFLLHIDSLCILNDLTDEQSGQLFKAMYQYQIGEVLELSPIIKIAFSQFKNQFDRDDEKYINTCESRKQAGSKGGKQRVANQANARKSKQDEANQAENKNKNKNKNKKDSDSEKDLVVSELTDATHIAEYLYNKILTIQPDLSSKYTSWIKDIDLAIRLDNRKKENLLRCIDWIYSNDPKGDFWKPNIKSGKKLREHYDTMEIQAKQNKKSNVALMDVNIFDTLEGM
tara:strand:+ start:1286 stop:1978 length:693 start_codon:yes stop_codon:yes gene_type:complete